MSIEDATFVVQRGDEQFSCLGSELKAKLIDADLLIAQEGDTLYQVKGSDLTQTFYDSLPAPKMRVKLTKGGSSDPWWAGNTKVYTPDGQELTGTSGGYYGAYIYPVVDGGEYILDFRGDLESRHFRQNTWDLEIIEGDLSGRSDDLHQFFEDFYGFTGEGILNIDVSQMKNFDRAFLNCSSLNQDFSTWNVKKATNMTRMFRNCTSMVQDLSDWCVPKVVDKSNFSDGAPGITNPKWGTCPKEPNSVPANPIDTALFIVTDGDNGHKSVTGAQVKALLVPQTMPWEDHEGGIFHVKNVSEELPLTDGPFTAWDIDGGNERQINTIAAGEELVFVTSPEPIDLFYNNQTQSWEFGSFTNTSKVTNLSGVFGSCRQFNGDISNWDVSNVTSLQYTFYDAGSFNQDLNNWDVSNVTNFEYTFAEAYAFNGDISNWNTSSAESMEDMFTDASSFNRDISSWNVAKVTKMDGMFLSASVFNQDLSQWCVPNFTRKPLIFDLEADAWTLPKPVWGTCPRGEDS